MAVLNILRDLASLKSFCVKALFLSFFRFPAYFDNVL